jgi:RNA polymerase sigma-70 factor (ECF subfamily)
MGTMNYPIRDVARLVAAARSGAPGAAGELLEAWSPIVLAWCNRLGGPTIHPEDAAQDVLVKALTHLDTVRDPARYAGWLFRVTRSVIRQHRRAAWVRRWMSGLSFERLDERPDPLEACEQRETARRVQAALETVSLDQRECLVLCDLEGRTAEEAAVILECPVGTVKSRLRLGRERFRRAALRVGLAPVLLDAYERGDL